MPPKPLSTAAATVVSAALLAVPALINGYPLAFYDSVDYIDMSFTLEPVVYRTMPYALLLLPGRLAMTLWMVAALQCLLAGWVLTVVTRAFLPGASALTCCIIAALLAALTSLPWCAGQIMPDVLGGLLALALAALLFARPALGWPTRIGLFAVGLVAAASHATFMLLAIGLALAMTLVWLALRRLRPGLAFIALPAAIAAGGVGVTAGVHYAATGRAFLSQSGDIFLLARFIQDDLVKPYLDRVCPSPDYKLCAYRDRLPHSANDFLWAYNNMLDAMGGWQGAQEEAHRIVWGSLSAFPLQHLAAAARDAAEQLISFRSGDGTWSQTDATAVAVARHYPHELHAYLGSLQQQDRFDFNRINDVHVPVATGGMVALVFLGLAAWRRRDLAGAGLALTLALAILGNAAICGALSNPGDRYASRMVWIAVFGSVVLALRPIHAPWLRLKP